MDTRPCSDHKHGTHVRSCVGPPTHTQKTVLGWGVKKLARGRRMETQRRSRRRHVLRGRGLNAVCPGVLAKDECAGGRGGYSRKG